MLVEFDPGVALDPGERVLLADRNQHVVTGKVNVRLAGRDELAQSLRIVPGFHFLEEHSR